MSDDAKNTQPDDDRDFDRLISAAGKSLSDEFIRPSADVIDAYLFGTANKSQKDLVRTAMLQSPEFRLEMRALAADLDFISSPEAKKNFAEAKVDDTLEFGTLVNERPSVLTPKDESRDWHSRVISLLTVPRYAGIAAAIFLIAISSIIYVNRAPSFDSYDLNLEVRLVDTGLLTSTEVRSESGPGKSALHPSAMEAALSVFRNSIEFENGIPSILKIEKGALTTDDSFVLRLTGPNGSSSDYIIEHSILDSKTSVKNVQFWILTVPRLSLYSLTLSENSNHAAAGIPIDNDFIVVCTWSAPAGYGAVRALTK